MKKSVNYFGKGKLIIVTDHHERENEGDLMFAAEFVTPDKINFLTKFGRGLVCVTITENHAKQLDLKRQEIRNSNNLSCAFTVSIDASSLSTSGISAADRSLTISKIARPDAKIEDFATPGHIFPVVSDSGGLKARHGHTEASIELCQRNNLFPAAVICEILADDGSSAKRDYLEKLSLQYDIPMLSISELLESM